MIQVQPASENPAREGADAFIATGTAALIAGLSAAGATTATGLYGAHKQSEAADNAARLQSDAAKAAAAQQDAAAQRAEAFQRQQAENEWRNSERVQRANYEQQKARLGTIAQFGSQYGVSGIGMPDYVPGTDPGYDTGASPVPASSAGTVAGAAPQGIDWTAAPDQLAQQISGYYKSRGVSDHETPYWVGKAAELVARGKALNDPQYADKRLAASEVFGGGAAPKGSIASLPAYMAPLTAPRLTTPIPEPYQPGTIAAYGRMR